MSHAGGPHSAVRTVKEAAERSPLAARAGDPGDFSNASVLIVDDSIQNVELLMGYLEDVGCDVRAAHDGPEALAEIERRQPDLILLDIMMPRMSGFQVCKQIKGNAATRDIQVIMVTALNEIADIEKARECGTDDFVTKPVNRVELVIRVTSLLRVRLLKQELERTISELKKFRDQGGKRATPAPPSAPPQDDSNEPLNPPPPM